MTNFEIDFTTNLRSLKLKKKDVAKKLNMTPPTLKTKIQKPEKITLLDLHNLLQLGFTINLKTILNDIYKSREVKNPLQEISTN